MIKRVKFKTRFGEPYDMVMDIIEEEKKFIYARELETNNPLLINRKDIIEISEPIIDNVKK